MINFALNGLSITCFIEANTPETRKGGLDFLIFSLNMSHS
jgi:hypothetical protein